MVARYANTLQKVPALCAIFHNDCQYLAYHCVTLGYRFKQGLQPPLQQWGTFVDMVPAFRQLADKHLEMMLKAQRDEIGASLDAAALAGLAKLDCEVSRSAAEKALLKVKHQLEHLQRIWSGVLPEGLYWRVLGDQCVFVPAETHKLCGRIPV